MRSFAAILFVWFLFGCTPGNSETKKLQAKVDSLENELSKTYKPGFGEFMSGIQVHHAKLWFAGTNQNWALADFEIHEIQESLEDIKKFCSDRPEARSVSMIDPAMDSVSLAIRQKDPGLFKNNYTLLTAACNDCHKATEHAFNIITVPTNLPVVNQDFKPVQ